MAPLRNAGPDSARPRRRRPSRRRCSSIVPPSSSTSRRAIESPRPEPGAFEARQNRSKARSRCSGVRPGPFVDHVQLACLRGDRDRRVGRRSVERVGEQVVEHLLDPPFARADQAAVALTPRCAHHAPRRAPTRARRAVRRCRRGEDRRAGRRTRRRARARAARRRDRTAARLRPALRRSRQFSSRRRNAISGVRSSCEASATNCSCDVSSAASLAVVRLNSRARLRTSDGPSVSLARAVSSPAPTSAATPSRRRSGFAIERASRRPTSAATARTISATAASARRYRLMR